MMKISIFPLFPHDFLSLTYWLTYWATSCQTKCNHHWFLLMYIAWGKFDLSQKPRAWQHAGCISTHIIQFTHNIMIHEYRKLPLSHILLCLSWSCCGTSRLVMLALQVGRTEYDYVPASLHNDAFPCMHAQMPNLPCRSELSRWVLSEVE